MNLSEEELIAFSEALDKFILFTASAHLNHDHGIRENTQQEDPSCRK